MQDTELYRHLLGLASPWTVARVELNAKDERVDVWAEHAQGARWPCPECKDTEAKLAVHDHASERSWRHLDSCQFMTCLHARPPRVNCPKATTSWRNRSTCGSMRRRTSPRKASLGSRSFAALISRPAARGASRRHSDISGVLPSAPPARSTGNVGTSGPPTAGSHRWIEAARTVQRHITNVLTYFEHRITNAVSEGLNSKIQTVKKRAYGFRNKEHFKTAIYFHCGGLELYPLGVGAGASHAIPG